MQNQECQQSLLESMYLLSCLIINWFFFFQYRICMKPLKYFCTILCRVNLYPCDSCDIFRSERLGYFHTNSPEECASCDDKPTRRNKSTRRRTIWMCSVFLFHIAIKYHCYHGFHLILTIIIDRWSRFCVVMYNKNIEEQRTFFKFTWNHNP